ncbi:hypothetical protein GW17_00024142 [Ensete ventricosum]|uniref:Uncharacterized protein n=1 Tax=Ensete ventricosum TaxID=4639 RepID=A0A426Z0Q8_ENSVE|nr:hypothetical protein B296_00003650 [Ensete ventricosum]RWW12207.1 hypothetical protein GW17_00024142 [Ensete ventricosum]RZR98508.1 hypothetical protein BHM03_00027867 [Ensete ventricosum]
MGPSVAIPSMPPSLALYLATAAVVGSTRACVRVCESGRPPVSFPFREEGRARRGSRRKFDVIMTKMTRRASTRHAKREPQHEIRYWSN